jgi:hypothetical protein
MARGVINGQKCCQWPEVLSMARGVVNGHRCCQWSEVLSMAAPVASRVKVAPRPHGDTLGGAVQAHVVAGVTLLFVCHKCIARKIVRNQPGY